MKNKWFLFISTLMMFVPWTILLLRRNAWALESPAAEIIIACYCAFIVFNGIFTSVCYYKSPVKNTLMQICLVVNNLYAVAGIGLAAWMLVSSLM